jgi:hypothetical protein
VNRRGLRSLVAGRWVPASIVAIRGTGRNTTVANVRMSFEPSQIFQDFENALDVLRRRPLCGKCGLEDYLGQLPTPAPGEHGGIPRLHEIGDCPKELAFDHSQAA